MVILGFLSLIQIAFLPGSLIIKVFKIKGSYIQKILLSFSLSLIINFQIVYLLTLIGLYTRPVIFFIFICEIILFFIFYKKLIFKKHGQKINLCLPYFTQKKDVDNIILLIIKFIILLLSIYYFIDLIIILLNKNPGIFVIGDTFLSWNRWAIDWYKGDLPHLTYNYPQLLPANYSLTYKFLGTQEIQFFNKFLSSFFPIGIFLIFIDMSIRFRSIIYLSAIISTNIFIKKIYTITYLAEGMADIPIAFFSLLVFYILLQSFLKKEYSLQNFYLSIILLSTAILTKQTGLYLIFLILIMCPVLLIKIKKNIWKPIIYTLLLFVILTFPWYIYKNIQISNKNDVSEVKYVTTDIYGKKKRIEIYNKACQSIFKKLIPETLLQRSQTLQIDIETASAHWETNSMCTIAIDKTPVFLEKRKGWWCSRIDINEDIKEKKIKYKYHSTSFFNTEKTNEAINFYKYLASLNDGTGCIIGAHLDGSIHPNIKNKLIKEMVKFGANELKLLSLKKNDIGIIIGEKNGKNYIKEYLTSSDKPQHLKVSTRLFHNFSFWQFVNRLPWQFRHKYSLIRKIVMGFFILLLIFSIHYSHMPYLLLFSIPYFFIWATYFSYDTRNIALILPFIGLGVSIGFFVLLKFIFNILLFIYYKLIKKPYHQLKNLYNLKYLSITVKVNKKIMLFLILIGFITIIILNIKYSYQRLITIQHYLEQKNKIINYMKYTHFYTSVHEKIYNYHHRVGLKGQFLTSDYKTSIIPEIGKFSKYFNISNPNCYDSFIDLMEKNRSHNKIKYLLISLKNDNKILEYLYNNYHLEVIFKHSYYTFYKILE